MAVSLFTQFPTVQCREYESGESVATILGPDDVIRFVFSKNKLGHLTLRERLPTEPALKVTIYSIDERDQNGMYKNDVYWARDFLETREREARHVLKAAGIRGRQLQGNSYIEKLDNLLKRMLAAGIYPRAPFGG